MPSVRPLAGLLILASCTSQVAPVVPAAPADVAAYAASLAPMASMPPGDYATIGENVINSQRCVAYFNQLASKANTTAQQQAQVSLLGSAAGGAIGLAGGPVGAAAGAALGAGLLNGFLATNSSDLGGAPPVATFGLVQQAQGSFQAASPTPMSLPQAAALVEGHGELCSPVYAQLLSQQAIMSARTGPIGPVAQAGFAQRSLAQPSLTQPSFAPPIIQVIPPGPATLTPPASADFQSVLAPRVKRQQSPGGRSIQGDMRRLEDRLFQRGVAG